MLDSKIFAIGMLALLAGPAIPAMPAAQDMKEPEQIVVTHHQVTVAGQTLKYMARAGLLPIRDNETGDIHAHMFFMAYTLDGQTNRPARPLTFLWNGGPGMNSSLIHMLGFGPKRVKTGDTYPNSPPFSETELEDNQETWLAQTDLVFVDPVGTGYSRPTKPEYAKDFLEAQGDIESVAEFIRLYRVRFDAWDSPLFIVGHSYGTTRAMGVSEALERRGIDLSGVVLMSGGFVAGQKPLSPGLTTALGVPGMAAAAFYHKKLAPDLQQDLQSTLKKAEAWAQDDYASALSRRESLSEAERESVIKGLARFTGLEPTVIDRKTLAADRDQFKTQLLSGRVLGNYDARLSKVRDPAETQYDIFKDPSFMPVVKLAQGTSILLNRYLRATLQFKSDMSYTGPLGGTYPPGMTLNRRFVRVRPDSAPAAAATAASKPPLRQALDANPTMRVFVARGLYDSGSCFVQVYTVNHLEPDLARRVSAGCYGAGHDMYSDKEVRVQLKRDIAAFIQKALPEVH